MARNKNPIGPYLFPLPLNEDEMKAGRKIAKKSNLNDQMDVVFDLLYFSEEGGEFKALCNSVDNSTSVLGRLAWDKYEGAKLMQSFAYEKQFGMIALAPIIAIERSIEVSLNRRNLGRHHRLRLAMEAREVAERPKLEDESEEGQEGA